MGAVYIFIRVVLQQVTEGVDAKFLAQYLFAPRSYARQEFYVLLEKIVHYINDNPVASPDDGRGLLLFGLLSDDGFGYRQVEGSGNLYVLAVALDDGDLAAEALYDAGVVGEL